MRYHLPILLALAGCGDGSGPPAASGTRVVEALRGSAEGFLQADPQLELAFPRDHGPHAGFRTEWWYFTGNLRERSTDDRRAPREFGFQLTFFRSGLTPEVRERSSPVAATDAWMAHFAVTDLAGERTLHAERFARGAPGFAGSGASPEDLYVGDWTIDALAGLGEDRRPSFRVSAREPGFALELLLTSEKPLVLQGDRGYSRKGSGADQASHYVSATRLAADGLVELGGDSHRVAGSAWLDREWTSSLLGEEQVGWDWFAIQLDDGTDLMAYRMRTRAGGVDPTAHGSVVDAGGASRTLRSDEYAIADTDTWTSATSGVTYPSGWRLTVPGEALELRLDVPVADCEIGEGYRYWEGPLRVSGTRAGRDVDGVGYAELVGYATAPPGR